MAVDDEPVSLTEVQADEGLRDWRLLGDGFDAVFRTESFAQGAEFTSAVAKLDGIGARRPDVDLRADGAHVRIITYTEQLYGLVGRDVDLARRISSLAAERGLRADPADLQTVQCTIDALDAGAVMPFWRAVLGYETRADSPDEDLIDPRWRGPSLWFQRMDEPRRQRNRIHFDVWVAAEQTGARVEAALAAGGRLLADHAPTWWVLADPEGNEVCVTSIAGRD